MTERRHRVGLLCGATAGAGTAYQEFARELCVELVRADIVLLHGGIPAGSTADALRAAVEAGGHVICVAPHLELRSGMDGARGCEVHVVRSPAGCRELVHRLADCFVVLPGGPNTFEALGELVTPPDLAEAKPVILVSQQGYFDPLLAQLDRALAEDFVTTAERSVIEVVDTVGGVLTRLGAILGAPAPVRSSPGG